MSINFYSHTVFKISLVSFTDFPLITSFLFCLQIKVSVQITPTLTFSFPFSSPAAISVSISFQISQETSLSLSKSVHLSEEKKVRHGPLFSVREGLSSFQKKNPALQKLREKKIAQGEPWVGLYYPGLTFEFKKRFLHKPLPTKTIMHNVKVRKKFVFQKITPLPPPPPLKR